MWKVETLPECRELRELEKAEAKKCWAKRAELVEKGWWVVALAVVLGCSTMTEYSMKEKRRLSASKWGEPELQVVGVTVDQPLVS